MDVRPASALDAVLEARERRAAARAALAAEGRASVSLTLNVPGWPKSSPALARFFNLALEQLLDHLAARRLGPDLARSFRDADAAGDFFLAPAASRRCDAAELKAAGEEFEAGHPLGRFLDVDVVDAAGRPVSSGRAKPCFVCGARPAVVCMRLGTHAPGEARALLETRVAAFLDEDRARRVARRLAEFALRAALYEVSLAPKPGLVDRFSAGAHDDMDFYTFLNSSAALAPRFEALAAAGWASAGDPPAAWLPRLRELGLEMERAMRAATGGANTHKGLIFLVGLALFGAARTIRARGAWDERAFRRAVGATVRGLAERELGGPADVDELSHGELAARRHGARLAGGARREAERGFPTVFRAGLPELRRRAPEGLPARGAAEIDGALRPALHALIAAGRDTNVLHRGGTAVLSGLRRRAKAALLADGRDGGAAERERARYALARRASAGGAADLLAVSLFVRWAELEWAGGPR